VFQIVTVTHLNVVPDVSMRVYLGLFALGLRADTVTAFWKISAQKDILAGEGG
jgi:hypothetical protein